MTSWLGRSRCVLAFLFAPTSMLIGLCCSTTRSIYPHFPSTRAGAWRWTVSHDFNHGALLCACLLPSLAFLTFEGSIWIPLVNVYRCQHPATDQRGTNHSILGTLRWYLKSRVSHTDKTPEQSADLLPWRMDSILWVWNFLLDQGLDRCLVACRESWTDSHLSSVIGRLLPSCYFRMTRYVTINDAISNTWLFENGSSEHRPPHAIQCNCPNALLIRVRNGDFVPDSPFLCPILKINGLRVPCTPPGETNNSAADATAASQHRSNTTNTTAWWFCRICYWTHWNTMQPISRVPPIHCQANVLPHVVRHGCIFSWRWWPSIRNHFPSSPTRRDITITINHARL
jgi:hypothetical protein